jgi:hypothetical protein
VRTDTTPKRTRVVREEQTGISPREVLYLRVRRVSRLIWLLAGILEGMIGLRVFLKLIAANPNSPFAGFIYTMTELFLFLFRGLTLNPASGNAVLEVHALIAMLFYALVTWVLVRLFWLIAYRPEDIHA